MSRCGVQEDTSAWVVIQLPGADSTCCSRTDRVIHSLFIRDVQKQHHILFSMSVPPAPNIYNPRSFISRPERDPGQHRIVNLVLQTLKSCPLMIVHHNTLPPLIHPCFVDFRAGGENPESLENCLSLMHMLRSKVRSSIKLFWKNVRWECERMREQVSMFIS
jgi:hypothetical protein